MKTRKEIAEERRTLTLLEKIEDRQEQQAMARTVQEISFLPEVGPEEIGAIHTKGYYALLALGEIE